MLKDTAILEAKCKRFIESVCKSEIVYALKEPRGFAYLYSNHFEDEEGNDALVLCFWSKEAYANACRQEDWSAHELIEIPLDLFLKNWCFGMAKDGSVAGIECDAQLFCVEKEPIELAIAIMEELTVQDKLESFKDYYVLLNNFLSE